MISDLIKVTKDDKDIQLFMQYLKSYLKTHIIKLPDTNSFIVTNKELLLIEDFINFSKNCKYKKYISCNTINKIFVKLLNTNSDKDIIENNMMLYFHIQDILNNYGINPIEPQCEKIVEEEFEDFEIAVETSNDNEFEFDK